MLNRPDPLAYAKAYDANVRQVSIDWVRRSLAREGISYGDAVAERLVATAEACQVRIELLITWIHDRHPGKPHTLEAWSQWCAAYAAARAQVSQEFTADRIEPRLKEQAL